MKYFYIACTDKVIEEKEKYYAYVVKVSDTENVLNTLSKNKNILHANIMPSKKEAIETARFWNECYRKNNTYLYQ